jgi:hypothetical protein
MGLIKMGKTALASLYMSYVIHDTCTDRKAWVLGYLNIVFFFFLEKKSKLVHNFSWNLNLILKVSNFDNFG